MQLPLDVSPNVILPTDTEFRHERAHVEIRDTPLRGKGVFAIKNIPANTRLMVYPGTVRPARANAKDTVYMWAFFRVTEDGYIDKGYGISAKGAQFAKYAAPRVNEPSVTSFGKTKETANVEVVWNLVRRPSPAIEYWSIREIKKGEELLVCYGGDFPRTYTTTPECLKGQVIKYVSKRYQTIPTSTHSFGKDLLRTMRTYYTEKPPRNRKRQYRSNSSSNTSNARANSNSASNVTAPKRPKRAAPNAPSTMRNRPLVPRVNMRQTTQTTQTTPMTQATPLARPANKNNANAQRVHKSAVKAVNVVNASLRGLVDDIASLVLVLHDTLIRATRNAKGTAIQNAVVEKPGRPPIYVFFSMLSGKRVTISLHYHPSEKRPSLIARLGPGATLLELKISCGTRCYVDLCMTRDTISADWRSNARFIDAVREIFKGTVLTRMKNVAQGPLVDILASPTEMSKVVSAMLRETYPWSPQRVNLAYPPKPITNTTGIRKVSVFPVPNVTMGQNGHRALNIAITKNRANVLLPRLKSMMHVMQSILLAKPWVDTPGLFNAHHVRHVTANLYVQYVKQFGMFVVHVSDDRHHSAALTSMTVRVTQDGTLAGFAIRHGYERLMIDMDNPARVLVSVSSFPNANAIHRSIMAFVTDVLPGKLRGTARGKLANVLQRPTFWAEVPRNTGAKIISTNKILTSPR